MPDLEGLALGTRTVRVLAAAGITSVEALVKHNERELLSLPGFGPGSMADVNAAL
jgi:DNA-directed RNA polymerase alpha subunit